MKNLFKNIVVAILSWEARMLLKRTKPKVIGITGSVGKTSTKDAIYAVLKGHVRVRKSEKSFNSELGVPLSVLGLPNGWNNPILWLKNIIDGFLTAIHPSDYPDVLVLEMGVDRPGDMAKLMSWIQPDVVVLTRLPDVPVHVEYFATPEAVIAEKRVLVDALKPEGVLVYNQDDEKVRRIAESIHQQAIGYSRYSLSQFTASSDKVIYEKGNAKALEFTLTHLDTASLMYVQGSLGVQHAYNYAAAAAVGSLFGISIEDATRALRDHLPPAGRMRLIPGIKETTVLDDTYNSSPVACERALQTLKELKGVKRRIAVLGDMLELGQYSVREHERMGELVAHTADVLITVGVRARGIARGALEHGMSEKVIFQYEEVERAGKELQEMLHPGDMILVKGSQGIRLEKLVEEIMSEPEKAGELLVRQSDAWKNR